MRLTDLAPRWFDVPGVGTDKDGVTFLCPHCRKTRLAVQFANPVEGPPKPLMGMREFAQALAPGHSTEERKDVVPPGYLWQRTGDTFETMTLSPSVDCSASGHWHGFLRNGEIA